MKQNEFIREYVEVRGGSGVLSETEKVVLCEMSSKQARRISNQIASAGKALNKAEKELTRAAMTKNREKQITITTSAFLKINTMYAKWRLYVQGFNDGRWKGKAGSIKDSNYIGGFQDGIELKKEFDARNA